MPQHSFVGQTTPVGVGSFFPSPESQGGNSGHLVTSIYQATSLSLSALLYCTCLLRSSALLGTF